MNKLDEYYSYISYRTIVFIEQLMSNFRLESLTWFVDLLFVSFVDSGRDREHLWYDSKTWLDSIEHREHWT